MKSGILFIQLIFISFCGSLLLAEKTEPVRLVFLGDSLTAGYLLNAEEAFPYLIGEMLRAEGIENTIINAGVSGDTSAGGIRRLEWILRKPLDILVIGLGANDALRGLDPENTRSNLNQMIAIARQKYPDLSIILAGMYAPPNMGEAYGRQFNLIYPEVAEVSEVTLYPFLLDGVAGVNTLNLPDGIHPNPKGHKLIAEKLYPYIQRILDQRKKGRISVESD